MIQLRDYQSAAVARVEERIAAGKRHVVLVAPTAAGKTVMASKLISSAVADGKSVVVIAHRKELLDQTVDKLARFGIEAGVIMGTDKRWNDQRPVQVCSIQTLARRLERRPRASLVIVDECHRATASSYRKVLETWPDAVVIGLTATPWPSQRRGLAELFEDMVLVATPAELIQLGALVEYDAYAYDAPELHKVRITAGDFNQRDLGIACNTKVLVGSVVREYLAHAKGRRAIVFPVNIEHSKALIEEFVPAGVRAAHVDGTTPKAERERILASFSEGSITVVASVACLSEGFDAPAAEVCILARPTKSLTLHLQMIGRILRPSPETGKVRALIHDHAGNLLRLGLPDDQRDYSLDSTPKRLRELLTCPLCMAVLPTINRDGTCSKCSGLIAQPQDQCRVCGKFKSKFVAAEDRCTCPVAESEGSGQKRVVEGRRINLDEIKQLRLNGVRSDLSDRQVVRAAHASVDEKKAEYVRLLQVCKRKHFKRGFADREFQRAFGHWPQFSAASLLGIAPAKRPFFPLPPRWERSA